MSRKKGGKTETIKERAIYVYLPSEELVEEWKNLARKAGVSLSKFVQEHVINSLHLEQDRSFTPRHVLQHNLRQCEEENRKLRQEIRKLEALVERLDVELRRYRLNSFNTALDGVKRFDPKLIDLFRRRNFVKSDELLPLLEISPRDTEAVKAINQQISLLETFGLLEPEPNGWRWLG